MSEARTGMNGSLCRGLLTRLLVVPGVFIAGLTACGASEEVEAVSESTASLSSELSDTPSVSTSDDAGTVATQRPTTAPTTLATTTLAPTTTTTTTSATEPTTTTEAEPVIANDAEDGLRFDVGHIASIEEVHGVLIIQFDRYQGFVGDSLVSGVQLQEEYIIGSITDWPFVNENPKLRSYPVAPSAQVVITSEDWLAGQDEFCGGDSSQLGIPVAFVPTVIETGLSGVVTSLTFDDLGWVTMIRFMLSC